MDTRIERLLNQVKGFKIKFTNKAALNNSEGEQGEFRVNKYKGVSRLYLKVGNKWNEIQLISNTIENESGTPNFVLLENGNTQITGNLDVNSSSIALNNFAKEGLISHINQIDDNSNAKNMTIQASAGRGSGSGGDIIFKTAKTPTLSTSSTVGQHSTIMTIGADGNTSVTNNFTIGEDLTVNGNNINFDAGHSTISVGSSSGTNQGGYRLIFEGGESTGNAAGGAIIFSTSLGGSTGDSVNSQTHLFAVNGTGNMGIRATSKLTFDDVFGGGHTYLQESSDDVLDMYVGSDKMLSLNEAQSKYNFLDDFKLYLDGGGENTYIYSNSATATLNLGADGSDMIQIGGDENKLERPVKILESANAQGDTAGYGQIWVKSNTPNSLMFTNDAGTDKSIEPVFYISCGWYQGSNAGRYLPLVAGQNEASSLIDFSNDDVFFIVPKDLKVTKVYINITRQSSSQAHPGNTIVRLAKNGSFISNSVTVNVDDTGYDTTNLYNVNTWDFSSETNSYSAGDIMQIYFDPTNTVYYCSATVVGHYT
jgi:hypothetical protein